MADSAVAEGAARRGSASQASETSQTAADYISSQLRLEAEAREALPYQFDTCTYSLGPLRQSVFSCLTCAPSPSDPKAEYTPAGVCYACSISCHSEHQLVELFTRKNFVCDCGTTRLPSTSTCSLRVNARTGAKGGVHSEIASAANFYNHNFRNKFCGCGEAYDPHEEKGTMFQCLGLGTTANGGCGEDWWHPECVLGLQRDWYKSTTMGEGKSEGPTVKPETNGAINTHPAATSSNSNVKEAALETISEEIEEQQPQQQQTNGMPVPQAASGVDGNDLSTEAQPEAEPEHPVPPGFPDEEAFDHLICYKCVEAFPWIKRYAGTNGFLPGVPHGVAKGDKADSKPGLTELVTLMANGVKPPSVNSVANPLKRKASSDDDKEAEPAVKRTKSEDSPQNRTATNERPTPPACKYATLPPAPTGPISLFLRPDFRDHLCHCPRHFPLLTTHPQLLEEETVYEPPVSSSGSDQGDGTGSVGSRSLLDRGEAALSNMDRVRAIEGVMAYNKLRDNLKGFLKPFAESGKAVGAEDIKRHFEKLRGDDQAIREAAMTGAAGGGGGAEGDGRREQGGY